jgi:hypothetical protein
MRRPLIPNVQRIFGERENHNERNAMQQIEMTDEIKASTDRMLESCERVTDLFEMIEQSLSKGVDGPELAAWYVHKAQRDGVLSKATALGLRAVYIEIAAEKLRDEIKKSQAEVWDSKSLMLMCTAPYTK